MAKSWYFVEVGPGREKRVEEALLKKINDGTFDSSVVSSVKIPVEEIIEIKDGKKKVKKNMLFPGYVMLEMDLPDIGWKDVTMEVRSTKDVRGFVCTDPNVRPRPISNDEAKNIFQKTGDIKGDKGIHVKQIYSVGDQVKVTEGPFATFSGKVEEVYADKTKLRVMVQIFGRDTPVEVDFTQVERLI